MKTKTKKLDRDTALENLKKLREGLLKTKPNSLIKVEQELHHIREKRAKTVSKMDEYQKQISLSEEVNTIDEEIGRLRTKLQQEREQWGPGFFKTLKPYDKDAQFLVEEAITLLEQAGWFYRERDSEVLANGLSRWSSTPTHWIYTTIAKLRKVTRSKSKPSKDAWVYEGNFYDRERPNSEKEI